MTADIYWPSRENPSSALWYSWSNILGSSQRWARCWGRILDRARKARRTSPHGRSSGTRSSGRPCWARTSWSTRSPSLARTPAVSSPTSSSAARTRARTGSGTWARISRRPRRRRRSACGTWAGAPAREGPVPRRASCFGGGRACARRRPCRRWPTRRSSRPRRPCRRRSRLQARTWPSSRGRRRACPSRSAWGAASLLWLRMAEMEHEDENDKTYHIKIYQEKKRRQSHRASCNLGFILTIERLIIETESYECITERLMITTEWSIFYNWFIIIYIHTIFITAEWRAFIIKWLVF